MRAVVRPPTKYVWTVLVRLVDLNSVSGKRTQKRADTAVRQTATSRRIELQNNVFDIMSILYLSSGSDAR
jgi:hypothetical protein